MYNTIIFDVDGTLVDSSLGIISSVKKVLDLYKLSPLTETELDSFIATSPIQKAFMQFCNINAEQAQECSMKYREFYLTVDCYKTKIYDGISDLLEYLQNKNYKMGIASYKRQDTLNKILSYMRLDKYFQCILGADSDNKLTKSDILYKCIQELKSEPKNTIFIGDSLSDAAAAKNIGCDFIAVKYGLGFKSKEEIESSQNRLIASDVNDIKYYFEGM